MNKKKNMHQKILRHSGDKIEKVSTDLLPKELQNKITRGLDDYKNGKYITDVQMRQKVSQWLDLSDDSIRGKLV